MNTSLNTIDTSLAAFHKRCYEQGEAWAETEFDLYVSTYGGPRGSWWDHVKEHHLDRSLSYLKERLLRDESLYAAATFSIPLESVQAKVLSALFDYKTEIGRWLFRPGVPWKESWIVETPSVLGYGYFPYLLDKNMNPVYNPNWNKNPIFCSDFMITLKKKYQEGRFYLLTAYPICHESYDY